jgi:hypothetical protein
VSRNFETQSISRRKFATLAGLVAGGAAGVTGIGVAEDGAPQQRGPSSYAFKQGNNCTSVEPIAGKKSAEQFYNWNVGKTEFSSQGTTDLQEPSTSLVFLYRAQNGSTSGSGSTATNGNATDQPSGSGSTATNGNATGQPSGNGSTATNGNATGQPTGTGTSNATSSSNETSASGGGPVSTSDPGLYLVVVHGKLGGNAGQGGSASFTFRDLPRNGSWVVQDDFYQGPGLFDKWKTDAEPHVVDWTWAGGRTDGAVYGPLGDDFDFVIEPAFNQQAALYGKHYSGDVQQWKVVTGGGSGVRKESLQMNQSLRIRSGNCQQ